MRPNLQEQLRQLIKLALEHSPYPDNKDLHRIWCIGLLTELLSYSAQNQQEVWHQLQQLIDNNDK